MKNFRKSLFSTVLALFVTISAIPGAVHAEEMTPQDDSEKTYTVTVVNGYNNTPQDTYQEGDRIAVTAGENPDGMVFTGWTSSGGGTFLDPSSRETVFVMPAENVTLMANFYRVDDAIYYTVIFDINGGMLARSINDKWELEGDLITMRVREGTILTPPPVYSYDLIFKGWDKPFEEIEEDTTYTALWARKWDNTGADSDDDDTQSQESEDLVSNTETPEESHPADSYTWEKTGEGYNLKAPDGSYVSGWAQVDGKWYYCKNGAMQTGWLPIQSSWYYLTPSGQMATGWQQVGAIWYYFSDNGVMQTGWLKRGSTWYYLLDWGGMATGWKQVGNTWYYLSSSGAMQTGWLKRGSTWYYLFDWGGMATGWHWVDGSCYYFYSSGAMASNTTVDGYRLNRNGQWLR